MAVAARSSLARGVGVYARISSDREGDQLGVRRQIEDCKRLAVERGWVVSALYVDDDISAWSGKPRPEYERLLAKNEVPAPALPSPISPFISKEP